MRAHLIVSRLGTQRTEIVVACQSQSDSDAGDQITKSLRTHFADIVDRGAYIRRREAEWPDLWRIGVLFLSGGASLSETISKLANDLFGLPGSAVPLLVAL